MASAFRWSEWSDEAFTEARERNVPVLLFVRASWCRFSNELEKQVLVDARVQKLLSERFVALRVDKDRRPDIDARYTKGGWPTLAWLADDGELLAADNFLEADELVARLELVSDYYARNRELIRASRRARSCARPRKRRPLRGAA